MKLVKGRLETPQRVILYGPEGIGKSTFASKFPNPVFIDTEGSTSEMDVVRTPAPSSWTMLMSQIEYFKNNPNEFDTIIIDTADWAERLCIEHLCARDKKGGIEDWGYGKGYTYLAEEYGRMLDTLTELFDRGMHVVLTAHAMMRKFEQPDEIGAYDRWELKLQRKTAPLVKEWATMVLFANYKTIVVNVDNQGPTKGTNKVQGGKRVIYTTHHPCWDAKNRHNLPEEIPLDYQAIAHCIQPRSAFQPGGNIAPQQPLKQEQKPVLDIEEVNEVAASFGFDVVEGTEGLSGVPKALADLMQANDVAVTEIQQVVAQRGYYPLDTPIDNYDPGFIDGVLVGAWPQVFEMIKSSRGGN